jgi:hypothetical protein
MEGECVVEALVVADACPDGQMSWVDESDAVPFIGRSESIVTGIRSKDEDEISLASFRVHTGEPKPHYLEPRFLLDLAGDRFPRRLALLDAPAR